jgi:hypothetical protein
MGLSRHVRAVPARVYDEADTSDAQGNRGYFSGDQVLACEGTGLAPVVPKTLTSGNTKRGLFTGQDFSLRRREGSLHLPGWPAPDQGAGPIRPLGRH